MKFALIAFFMIAVGYLTEVRVLFFVDVLAAYIAHPKSTRTSHLIATLNLEKSGFTFWTFSYSSICHSFFD
jgi:hypothetical protein